MSEVDAIIVLKHDIANRDQRIILLKQMIEELKAVNERYKRRGGEEVRKNMGLTAEVQKLKEENSTMVKSIIDWETENKRLSDALEKIKHAHKQSGA